MLAMMRPVAWACWIVSLGYGIALHVSESAPAKRPKGEVQGEPLDKRMYFLDYMPEYNFIPCGCAKCGTTAMLNFIYSRTFGHDWPYLTDADHKDIHNVFSWWWEHKRVAQFELVWDKERQKELMDSAYSMAIIRDPMSRLISSYKSKIQCDGGPGGGDPHRAAFVMQLRALQGLGETGETCLALDDFAEALHQIHKNNDARYLNDHFLPQHLGCFYTYHPGKWTKVIEIDHQDTFKLMAERFNSTNVTLPGKHSSSTKIQVSQKAYNLLKLVTAKEYEVLGKYLSRPSPVMPGAWV
eukprot:CAMPEP_0170594022 /NCGR_PEP_ID=MMETSP0224-20130122/13772_1 /TAXON_ID=285029 /ORGANISM="Togula jolla, Strain CCCM 725" /LENGTH=296 /DNA_ID=CAMNT_0010918039 /DNA_START=236 /DNA_END=1126 /DNA_ORIENTATION=+